MPLLIIYYHSYKLLKKNKYKYTFRDSPKLPIQLNEYKK